MLATEWLGLRSWARSPRKTRKLERLEKLEN